MSKKNTNLENKTERANRIAEQSKKVKRTYEKMEDFLFRVLRAFSTFLDKVLFNEKYSKVVSLALAVLLYAIVNYNALSTSFQSSLRYSKTLSDVTVLAKYNSDTFEISGLPEKVDVILTGDAANVTSAANAENGTVICDLDGLTEGEHEIKLTTEGYGNNVNVVVNPTNVNVVMKKKTTRQFDISYDFINQDKMEQIYSAGTPEFEYTKINVRASKDTLDSIAFVKALIDVSGQSADFEQDAVLVAYDSSGKPVNADIVPNTVHVKVPVTSPNKSVNIQVQVSGEVPDGKAIDSITMDQQTVTIYGSETTLANIDQVVVTLDAGTLTKDSTVLRPIVLPAGVTSATNTQVTMNITLADAEEKTIDDIPINVINNNKHYKASQPDNKTTTSVTVKGTKNNIDKLAADDINVYIDMKDVQPGLQKFALQIEQPKDGFVVYTLNESEYELNVLGETSDADQSEGGNVNND
ncbi:MAG: CdaR family protein [Bulleidia sp.]|nr:CdaR family protein [Bulleidia sp.]